MLTLAEQYRAAQTSALRVFEGETARTSPAGAA